MNQNNKSVIGQFISRESVVVRFLCIIIIPIILIGCSHVDSTGNLLQEAETVINSNPHRSLQLLDSLGIEKCSNDNDRALFILLHAIAEDKTYDLSTPDSVITIALNHFRQTQDKTHLRMAHTIKGRILDISNQTPLAIVNLIEAERLIDDSTPEIEKGLLYHELAECYNKCLNGTEAIAYINKAYVAYNKENLPIHCGYCLADKASYFNNLGNYDSAYSAASSALVISSSFNDSILRMSAYEELGYTAVGRKNYADALRYLRPLEHSTTVTDQTLGLLSLAESMAGNKTKADSISHALLANGSSWGFYGINTSNASINDLYQSFKLVDNRNDSLLYNAYSSNLNTLLQENYNINTSLLEAKSKYHNLVLWSVISVITFIAIVLMILLLNYRHKAHIERANAFEASEELAAFMQQYEQNATDLSSQKMLRYNETKSYLTNQLHNLNLLAEACYGRQGKKSDGCGNSRSHAATDKNNKQTVSATPTGKPNENTDKSTHNDERYTKISKAIDSIISDFQKDETITRNLIQITNSSHDDIITKFNNEFPNLREEESLLFLYIVYGLKPLLISLFLNMNGIEHFAVRKYRLKTKIKSSNTKLLDEFLKYF